MRCTKCGNEMRVGSEEYCKDVNGNPMYKNFAYCDTCKIQIPLEYYYSNITNNQDKQTKKNTFLSLSNLMRNTAGVMLIIAGVIGIIACFFSMNIFTTIFILCFTICFFGSGVYFLSPKGKPKSNNHPNNTPYHLNAPLFNNASSNENSNNSIKTSTTPIRTYINENNVIRRLDDGKISDEEIPNLIQMGYENALKKQQSMDNPKFHRTEEEKELSFQFISKYGHDLETYINKFEVTYDNASKTNDLTEEITLLNESISALEKAKSFCYSKGKGGTIYFQDMYENLHNSKNQCFSYLDNIKSELSSAIYRKDVVIPNILDVIKKNDGIYQSNIYQFLPNINKTIIQHTLKSLDADSKILRIKKGNTYELHLKINNSI